MASPVYSERCVQCLTKWNLVENYGEHSVCIDCQAPRFELLDAADEIPLLFFTWLQGSISLSTFVDQCRMKNYLVELPFDQVTESKLKTIAEDWGIVQSSYQKIVAKSHANGSANAEPFSLDTHGSSAQHTAQDLKDLRKYFFEPVTGAISKMLGYLQKTDAEFELLRDEWLLEDLMTESFETLKLLRSFSLLTDSEYRLSLQVYTDTKRPELLKATADRYSKFAALQKFAFHALVRDQALHLQYLDAVSFDSHVVDHLNKLNYTIGTADPAGYIVTLAQAPYLERLVQVLSYKSYQVLPGSKPPAPLRSVLSLTSIRATLLRLSGQHPILDAFLGLVSSELGLATDEKISAAVEAYASKNSKFALVRALTAKPFNREQAKELIEANGEANLNWLVGAGLAPLRLPVFETATLSPEDYRKAELSAREILKQLRADTRTSLATATFNGLRKQLLDSYINVPEWNSVRLPATLKNVILQILMREDSDSRNIEQYVGMLTCPPETFWSRPSIELTKELAIAITGPDDWGFRFDTFLGELRSLTSFETTKSLKISSEFLPTLIADFLSSSSEGQSKKRSVDSLTAVLKYVAATASIHRNTAVLTQAFYAWLEIFRAPMYTSEVVSQQISLSQLSESLGAQIAQPQNRSWVPGFQKVLTDVILGRCSDSQTKEFASLLSRVPLVGELKAALSAEDYRSFVGTLAEQKSSDNVAFFELLEPGTEAKVQKSKSDSVAATKLKGDVQLTIATLQETLKADVANEQKIFQTDAAALSAKFKLDLSTASTPAEKISATQDFKTKLKEVEERFKANVLKLNQEFAETAKLLNQSAS